MNTAITFRPPAGLPRVADKPGWQNTFEVRSQSSGHVYRVAQNTETRQWGCSCAGFCIKKAGKPRGCKHLKSMGLREHEIHGNALLTGGKGGKRLAS